MYGPSALERRRCLGTRQDGSPCQAWAVWDDDRQLCMAHAGRHHRGPIPKEREFRMYSETRYRPCTCIAYAWPHRPGSGVCRWPEYPMLTYRHPAGVHGSPRLRGSLAVFKLIVNRRQQERAKAAREQIYTQRGRRPRVRAMDSRISDRMRLDIDPQETESEMTHDGVRLVRLVERYCLACGDRGPSVYCRRCHARTILESIGEVVA
jgi:hypothetical protein